MAEVVEPHPRQAGPIQQGLEVLRQPGPVDRVAPFSDEGKAIVGRFVGALLPLARQVSFQSRHDERGQGDGRL